VFFSENDPKFSRGSLVSVNLKNSSFLRGHGGGGHPRLARRQKHWPFIEIALRK
jgi:hypothetical protein